MIGICTTYQITSITIRPITNQSIIGLDLLQLNGMAHVLITYYLYNKLMFYYFFHIHVGI